MASSRRPGSVNSSGLSSNGHASIFRANHGSVTDIQGSRFYELYVRYETRAAR